MNTTVYVDGYNLYYSALKGSAYKWLNLYHLFESILHSQSPRSNLNKIKYYTADVKSKFASHGALSQQAQQNYHRALESTGRVEIIKGAHFVSKSTPLRYNVPPDPCDRVAVWDIEEKHTDVTIALDMYRDVVRGHSEQVVLCSNDTDLVTALKYIREDYPGSIVGLVCPLIKDQRDRRCSKSLSTYAHWVRNYIMQEELASSVFAPRVPTKKKPIDKPEYW